MPNDVLRAGERAELAAYEAQLNRGRLFPGQPAWPRYMVLLECKESGLREKLDAPTDAAGPDPVLEPAADYQLSGEPAVSGRAAWVPLYAEPGEKADSILRWFKRLVADGRTAKKPPPLHDPLALEAWYAEMVDAGQYKHKTCRRLQASAARARNTAVAPMTAPNVPAPEPHAEEWSPVPEYEPAPDETSPFQMLKRLQLEEATLHAELRRMRQQGKTSAEQASVHAKWIAVQELLGHQHQRVEKTKGMLDPAVVGEKVRRFFGTLPEATKRILIRLSRPEPEAEEIVRRLFERLPDEIEEMLTAP